MRRRRIVDDYSEVKRMYTRPAARGLGLAKALLRRIEDEARAVGAPVLRLETGIHQQEAIGLYGVSAMSFVRPLCDDVAQQNRNEPLL